MLLKKVMEYIFFIAKLIFLDDLRTVEDYFEKMAASGISGVNHQYIFGITASEKLPGENACYLCSPS